MINPHTFVTFGIGILIIVIIIQRAIIQKLEKELEELKNMRVVNKKCHGCNNKQLLLVAKEDVAGLGTWYYCQKCGWVGLLK